MSRAIVCRPPESAFASADTSSSSGTTANEVSATDVLLALERRQRQQIVDEALHAPRLLRHQLQVLRALARLELEVLQRFQKAG